MAARSQLQTTGGVEGRMKDLRRFATLRYVYRSLLDVGVEFQDVDNLSGWWWTLTSESKSISLQHVLSPLGRHTLARRQAVETM